MQGTRTDSVCSLVYQQPDSTLRKAENFLEPTGDEFPFVLLALTPAIFLLIHRSKRVPKCFRAQHAKTNGCAWHWPGICPAMGASNMLGSNNACLIHLSINHLDRWMPQVDGLTTRKNAIEAQLLPKSWKASIDLYGLNSIL